MRIEPGSVVTPDLLAEVRAHKAELLAVLPEAPAPRWENRSKESATLEAGPRRPLRVVVDDVKLRRTPFDLTIGVRVIDAKACVRADLAQLEATVVEYSRVWAGPDEDPRLARELGERIEDLLERLESCGARVRVVALS